MSDQWHTHLSDEAAPQLEHASRVSPKWMALTFIGMVFGVLFVIIVLVVYFNNYMNTYKAKLNETTTQAEASYDEKMAVRDRLADPAAGQVRVSINDAMDLVIADYEASSN